MDTRRMDGPARVRVGVQRPLAFLAGVPPCAREAPVRAVAYTPREAYAVQTLARHQLVEKVLADIAMDMTICRLEGWDVWELPRMLLSAVPAPPEKGR